MLKTKTTQALSKKLTKKQRRISSIKFNQANMNSRLNNKTFLDTTCRCLTITEARSTQTYTTKRMETLILVWWLSHCIINNKLYTKTTKYYIMPHWWKLRQMRILDLTIRMVLDRRLQPKRCLVLDSQFTNTWITWCFLNNPRDPSLLYQTGPRITVEINSIQTTYFKFRKLHLNRQSNHSRCSRSQLNLQSQQSTSFWFEVNRV